MTVEDAVEAMIEPPMVFTALARPMATAPRPPPADTATIVASMLLKSLASTLTYAEPVTELLDSILAVVWGVMLFFARTPPPAAVTTPPAIAAATGVDFIDPVEEASTSTAPDVASTFELLILAVVLLVMVLLASTKPILAAAIPTDPAKPSALARIAALSVALTVTVVPLTTCKLAASASTIRASTVL